MKIRRETIGFRVSRGGELVRESRAAERREDDGYDDDHDVGERGGVKDGRLRGMRGKNNALFSQETHTKSRI